MIKILLSFLLLSVSANAATPLITKVNQTGHVPASYRQTMTCEVYLRRVVVTTLMSYDDASEPVKTRRIFPVSITKNLHEMIRNASTEEYQSSNIQICDAATTTTSAAAPGIKSFILFNSGNCSQPRGERVGGSSKQLRDLVNSFCPETNDPGGSSEL